MTNCTTRPTGPCIRPSVWGKGVLSAVNRAPAYSTAFESERTGRPRMGRASPCGRFRRSRVLISDAAAAGDKRRHRRPRAIWNRGGLCRATGRAVCAPVGGGLSRGGRLSQRDSLSESRTAFRRVHHENYRKLLFGKRHLLACQIKEDAVYIEYVIDGRQDDQWLLET